MPSVNILTQIHNILGTCNNSRFKGVYNNKTAIRFEIRKGFGPSVATSVTLVRVDI